MNLPAIKYFRRTVDLLVSPYVFLSSIIFLQLRKSRFLHYPISKKIIHKVGVYPIRDHYYEPLFNPDYLKKDLNKDRCLPGLDLNIDEQICFLDRFNYNEELLLFPVEKTGKLQYSYDGGMFNAGDAEYLYSMIRLLKPKKIIEIGSGYSTMMMLNALRINKMEEPDYSCEIKCIEPYENNWLNDLEITLIRKPVEEVDISIFKELGKNDILFIDSSHIIRPQGDVLFEYIEALPQLNKGVYIHIHDIFTPKDYPKSWVIDEVRFWNEQYLLEALLTNNKKFKIIGALNFLKHNFPEKLYEKCPVLKRQQYREPSSFWIVKM